MGRLGPFELDTIVCGDCLDIMRQMPDGCVDAVITDPPYPDIDKGWPMTPIEELDRFSCRQFVFWSAVEPFPLDWTAVHIWHKPNGWTQQHYERIFERNGKTVYRVFRVPIINYDTLPEWVPHPTQKPLRLLMELLNRYTQEDDLVFDPFMGSGTTAVAAKKLGRHFFGCDINPEYVEMARKRVAKVDGVQLELI